MGGDQQRHTGTGTAQGCGSCCLPHPITAIPTVGICLERQYANNSHAVWNSLWTELRCRVISARAGVRWPSRTGSTAAVTVARWGAMTVTVAAGTVQSHYLLPDFGDACSKSHGSSVVGERLNRIEQLGLGRDG